MFEEYKKITSIVVPYAVFCAFLNLYYYWKPFGIQPFEFISVSEALAYSVSFIIFAGFMLMPVLLIEILKPSNYEHGDENNQNKIFIFLVSLTIILNGAIIIIAELNTALTMTVLYAIVCGVLPGAINLSYSPKLIEHFPSGITRTFLCLILCCLPGASVIHSIEARTGILEKTNYQYMHGTDFKNGLENAEVIYIGHLGKYIFVMPKDKEATIMYPISSLKRLRLYEYNKESHNKAN